MVERAYAAHLDASGRTREATLLRARVIDGDPPPLPMYGVLVYAARSSGLVAPAPSVEPWAHLARLLDRF